MLLPANCSPSRSTSSAQALADALGIREFIAVGYSMGGPIAKLCWSRHPERVRGLVLPGEDLRNVDSIDGIELLEGDVRDGDAVRRAVSGCGSVFHLASIYAVWTRKPGTRCST